MDVAAVAAERQGNRVGTRRASDSADHGFLYAWCVCVLGTGTVARVRVFDAGLHFGAQFWLDAEHDILAKRQTR